MGSRFLIELRDNKKIMGTRCTACDLVYVPARSVCKHCFEQLDKWVEVSDKGTLQTYTVAGQANGVQPVDPPIIYGVILLDGASTGLVHMLSEVDFEKLAVGMRVKAVFREKTDGQHPGHQVLRSAVTGCPLTPCLRRIQPGVTRVEESPANQTL